MLRLVRILDGFLQTQLIALHLGDARLIGFHNPIVPRIDDTIDQGIDLLVELADLLAGGIAAHGCLAETLTRTLARVKDGVATVLAEESGDYRHFARQDLRIAVGKTGIIATLDDELLFDGPVTDPDPLAGGTVGFLSRFMDRVEFDNVVVTEQSLAARALGDRRAVNLDGDGAATLALTAAATISPKPNAAYEWLIDGAVVATGQSVEIAAPVGTEAVTLRVTDADGATSTDRMSVDVEAADAILLCEDFEGNGAPDGLVFVDKGDREGPSEWSVSDGAPVQSSNIFSGQQGTGSRAYSVESDGPFILRDGP